MEFYLFDPLHGKPIYGSRGKLIATLLEDWVREQKEAAAIGGPSLVPEEPERTDHHA